MPMFKSSAARSKLIYTSLLICSTAVIFLAVALRVTEHNHIMRQRSELRLAMARGDTRKVRELVESDVPVSMDNKGDLPIAHCVDAKDYESLRLLLERGARADGKAGADALVLAAKRRDARAIRMLMNHGADPDKRNSFGETANQAAALDDDRDTLSLLKRRQVAVPSTKQN